MPTGNDLSPRFLKSGADGAVAYAVVNKEIMHAWEGFSVTTITTRAGTCVPHRPVRIQPGPWGSRCPVVMLADAA